MKRITILIAFFSVLTLNGQTFKISEFKFESIFGTTLKEPDNIYCLLGTGFFRTPRSENSDSLIYAWIGNHPNAIVVPISSMRPIDPTKPESKMIYCLVIEGNDTLNNYLIKNGCFPGATMMRHETWKEMKSWEKKLYKKTGGKKSEVNVKVYISEESYKIFIEQIKSAEIYAQENKIGIWKTKN